MTMLQRTRRLSSQIFRDEAWRALPLRLAATSLVTIMLLGVCYSLAAWWRQLPSLHLLVSILWLAAAIHLLFGGVRSRCSRLDMALPLSTRGLWRAHVVAVLLSGAMVLGVSTGFLVLINSLMGKLRGVVTPEVDLPRLATLLGTGLLLAVALLESRQPGLRKIVLRGASTLWLLAVLAGVLAVVLVLATLPPAWLTLPLGGALALGYRIHRRLPPAYTLAPRAADGGEVPADSALERVGGDRQPAVGGAATGRPLSWFLLRTVHQTCKLGSATPWLYYPLFLIMGVVLSGLLAEWVGDDDIRFLYIPFATYLLLAFVGPSMNQFHQLDPLPISRRLLFAVLTLPGLLALIASYGAGRIGVALVERPTELVEYRIDERGQYVWVPERFLEVAWGGETPILDAPWGESHPAWSLPLFRGSRARVFSPFIAAEDSSARFEALMVSRAAEVVYGGSPPPGEILQRYFRVEGDRLLGLAEGGLTLRADYPDLVPGDAGPAFPVILALAAVPWLLLVALFLRTYREGLAAWVRQAVFWTPLALILGVMGGQVALAVADWLEPWVVRGLTERLIWRLGLSAVGAAATWIASALLILGAYRLAEAEFRRIEVPARPTRFTLLDWVRAAE